MTIVNRDLLMKNMSKEQDFPLTFEEWEQQAAENMLPGGFGYASTGAGRGETEKRNAEAFSKWAIVPRILQDVSTVDMSVKLFGRSYKTPFFLAPIGVQVLAYEEAERATAKAAAVMEIPLIVSTVSTCSLEEIAEAVPSAPKWFQLYFSSVHPELSYSMVERAEKSGYEAIVITVDTVMAGWREQDIRSGFSPLALGYGKGNYVNDPVFMKSLPNHDQESVIASIFENIQHPNLTWKDIAEVKKRTSLPVLIKGILHPEDAKIAVEYGVDGIIVSNHGGRQLDGVIASIDALPEIVEAVKGQIPILLDSGVRRGIDAVKALALGAAGVLIGRPFLYGLAAAGQKGVEKVLERFIQETEVSLALSGMADLKQISKLKMVRQ
ncbi:alpha-hydroxy-acid oxidizing protein [Niallia endozanthoxylica]|uniref:L-lactate oxidase n=1 Tax=Niallia endozanthoxylica TaxID=2036016 RepID=A0A5J5HZL7_9BACI|nr:alpha-hydroxy-acid oxidizing protein [Niallia endozanthoxylica]KAA9028572.1 alpha-hydroxy-acid oxidizing protein [Niallia endozanthoxylica]